MPMKDCTDITGPEIMWHNLFYDHLVFIPYLSLAVTSTGSH